MTIYRVEVKKDYAGWDDWGSLHFHVTAKNDRDAYKKA